jgi:hypothetical protein
LHIQELAIDLTGCNQRKVNYEYLQRE